MEDPKSVRMDEGSTFARNAEAKESASTGGEGKTAKSVEDPKSAPMGGLGHNAKNAAKEIDRCHLDDAPMDEGSTLARSVVGHKSARTGGSSIIARNAVGRKSARMGG